MGASSALRALRGRPDIHLVCDFPLCRKPHVCHSRTRKNKNKPKLFLQEKLNGAPNFGQSTNGDGHREGQHRARSTGPMGFRPGSIDRPSSRRRPASGAKLNAEHARRIRADWLPGRKSTPTRRERDAGDRSESITFCGRLIWIPCRVAVAGTPKSCPYSRQLHYQPNDMAIEALLRSVGLRHWPRTKRRRRGAPAHAR
jgi:hypothetical protein